MLWNSLTSPDVAARLAEAIRSDLPTGFQAIDTFGAPPEYYQYIVREALRLHKGNPDAARTGLFINSAPRTNDGKNGEPFYRADFDANLCIVATPLSVFSSVRNEVKKLQALPNEDNGLYGEWEQHRSSFTPRLLADNHGLRLLDIDPSAIPALPAGCTVAHVDRFGNLVLSIVGEDKERIHKIMIENQGETLSVRIGAVARDIYIGTSMGAAEPGTLVFYHNDDHIEIICKWSPDWAPDERLEHSAYAQFGRPGIGAEVAADV